MEPFTRLHGRAAPLMRANIDTDALISAQAMVGGQVADPGKVLFTHWRYLPDGSPNPDFVLNQPRYGGTSVLVAARNFGCGSSREHAVWALTGYGIRCVIAPSFGEIFYDNAFQNGLLLAIVTDEQAEHVADIITQAAEPDLTVDLENRLIILPDGRALSFEIPAERREALLGGLDDLDLLRARTGETDRWLETDRAARSWAYPQRKAI